jgi:hydrogenase maturation protease
LHDAIASWQKQSLMASILIVGYGNRLRSDDGLGVRAAEELSKAGPAVGTEILVRHQLTPELAETISHVELVLFLDASRVGQPGEIRCTQVDPHPPEFLFAHQLTPETLLSLCSELYGRCPQAFQILLCGECFDLGDELSARAAAGLPHLVEVVQNFCLRPA